VAFTQVNGALPCWLAPLIETLVDSRRARPPSSPLTSPRHLAEGVLARGLATRCIGPIAPRGGRRGRIVREGARVALSGATSVGKSSMFN
jgi:hypothetical protein